jgi:hypothetical protein
MASTRRATLFSAMALVASFVVMSVAAPAFAAPKGEYAVFSDCPLSSAAACLYAKTESGSFVVGKKTVPIEHAITLQGGLNVNDETEAETFVAAADGNTLSKTPQAVPGGLAGLVNCKEISNFFERIACEAVFENGLTGVNATTELAGPASTIGINTTNLIIESGIALNLPVKVHLENPLLGSECFVGSNAKPVHLELTTGATSPPLPNKSIHGSKGSIEFGGEGGILILNKNSLVNNSFAAPEATGCGGAFSFIIDPIINAELGTPAAAGHNTAILNGKLEQTSSEEVKNHS